MKQHARTLPFLLTLPGLLMLVCLPSAVSAQIVVHIPFGRAVPHYGYMRPFYPPPPMQVYRPYYYAPRYERPYYEPRVEREYYARPYERERYERRYEREYRDRRPESQHEAPRYDSYEEDWSDRYYEDERPERDYRDNRSESPSYEDRSERSYPEPRSESRSYEPAPSRNPYQRPSETPTPRYDEPEPEALSAEGQYLRRIPRDAEKFRMGGKPFYMDEGVFYKPVKRGYIIVPPPIGMRVKRVPKGARPQYIDGLTYYEINGTYYLDVPHRRYFEIVPAPRRSRR